MLKPIEKQRVADEIVNQLRSLILSGKYPPGSKLPPERELAKTLGVNRSSLREALKKLEQGGLIRIRQGDGTRVENFMETAGIELLGHLIPMARQPEMISDVLEFRAMLGREIARLAAERIEAPELDKVRALVEQAKDPKLDNGELFRLDFDIYVALTSATRNRVLVLLVNTVREAIKHHTPMLAVAIVSPEYLREHHQRLLAALAARDTARTMAVVDDHIGRGNDVVKQLVDSGMLAFLTA
jgi:GntR family transcriptional repressor for pyruvate dehydrogenase complex